MTEEQKYILRCLSDYLNNNEPGIESIPDISEVFRIAKQHQIESIIYSQSKRNFNFEKCSSTIAASVYYSKTRDNILAKINKAFSENQIEYLIFKGPEIAAILSNTCV